MASNTELVELKDRGWLNGFAPLWHKGRHDWWGKGSWLLKILIWVVIIDGLIATVAFATPKIEQADPQQGTNQAKEVGESSKQSAMMLYFILAAIIPASGVIIFGPESIIDERKMGTAAWVLSKPVSRAAFLLSRFCADALGVLTTMVLVQGVIAYFIFNISGGYDLSASGFLGGLALIFLFLLFYLALILMLGTLFQSRGAVIGISLGILCVSYLTNLVPGLSQVMPSGLILGLEPGQPSLAEAMAQGQSPSTVVPIFATIFLILLFVIVAITRFEREEF